MHLYTHLLQYTHVHFCVPSHNTPSLNTQTLFHAHTHVHIDVGRLAFIDEFSLLVVTDSQGLFTLIPVGVTEAAMGRVKRTIMPTLASSPTDLKKRMKRQREGKDTDNGMDDNDNGSGSGMGDNETKEEGVEGEEVDDCVIASAMQVLQENESNKTTPRDVGDNGTDNDNDAGGNEGINIEGGGVGGGEVQGVDDNNEGNGDINGPEGSPILHSNASGRSDKEGTRAVRFADGDGQGLENGQGLAQHDDDEKNDEEDKDDEGDDEGNDDEDDDDDDESEDNDNDSLRLQKPLSRKKAAQYLDNKHTRQVTALVVRVAEDLELTHNAAAEVRKCFGEIDIVCILFLIDTLLTP